MLISTAIMSSSMVALSLFLLFGGSWMARCLTVVAVLAPFSFLVLSIFRAFCWYWLAISLTHSGVVAEKRQHFTHLEPSQWH